jgi:hypothetical protein
MPSSMKRAKETKHDTKGLKKAKKLRATKTLKLSSNHNQTLLRAR